MPEEYPFPPSPIGNQNPPRMSGDSTPPPPPPPITVRTMETDTQSIQSSGGTPIPQQVRPDEIKLPEPEVEEQSPFSSANTLPAPEEEKATPKWVKTTGVIIGILILIAGFGALGYYVVYPIVFSPETETAQETAGTPAQTTPPALPDTEQPSATGTPAEQPQTGPAHVSLFSSTTQSEPITIATISAESIKEVLAVSGAQTLANDSVKEIVFETSEGLVRSSEFLPAILPVFETAGVASNFEDDFTAYLYYDTNGVWPGFVFKLKDTAVLFEAQQLTAKIETAQVSDLKNLYIADPKEPKSQTFFDGKVKDIATKYLSFETTGASLNYGVINNYLLISSSYSGIQKAANLLGL